MLHPDNSLVYNMFGLKTFSCASQINAVNDLKLLVVLRDGTVSKGYLQTTTCFKMEYEYFISPWGTALLFLWLFI